MLTTGVFMQKKNIKVADLRLDLHNPRVAAQPDERSAIKAMIEEFGKEIIETAKDILRMGRLSPAELIMVVEHEDESSFYTVLEGNRRLTALKLMKTPNLAPEGSVRDIFKKLHKEYSVAPVDEVECVIFDAREDAMPWIERRHKRGMGGRGVISWGRAAADNFDAEFGRVTRSKAVMDLLKAHDLLSPTTESTLNKDKRAAMDRLFTNSEVQDIGILFNKSGVSFGNGDVAGGLDLLRRILEDMARPDWNTNTVRFPKDRLTYVALFKEFSVSAKPDAPTNDNETPQEDTNQDDGEEGHEGGTSANDASDAEAGAAGGTSDGTPRSPDQADDGGVDTTDGTGDHPDDEDGGAADPVVEKKKKEPAKGAKRSTLDRKCLPYTNAGMQLAISKSCPRLGRIYLQAKKLKVDDHPNAASFLMRALIEMSVEEYLDHKKVPVPQKSRTGRWDDENLKKKVEAVLADLDPESKNKDLSAVRRATSNEDNFFSIATLHSYIHNRKTEPAPHDLKLTYEAWFPFLKAVHEMLG